jgi:hypothetical protein
MLRSSARTPSRFAQGPRLVAHLPHFSTQLMRVRQPAAPPTLQLVDLLNIRKALFVGPTWSNFTRLLLIQPSWGRILPLGSHPPGQLLAGSVFEVLYLSWGGAKRARTADLLHAMKARHFH